MSKTPKEITEEHINEQAIRWVKTLPPASERCNQCACEGYKAGYEAATVSVLDQVCDFICNDLSLNETQKLSLLHVFLGALYKAQNGRTQHN